MAAPMTGPAGDEPAGDEPAGDQSAGDQSAGDEPAAWESHLLGELGRALGSDEVPDGLHERAEALVELAGLDAQLARLLEGASPQLAGVRGTVEVAAELVFEVADGSLAVELATRAAGAGFRLTGHVVGDGAPASPPGRQSAGRGEPLAAAPGGDQRPVGGGWLVTVERADRARRTTETDELGRFALDDVAPGRLRLRLAAEGRVEVTTEWFVL